MEHVPGPGSPFPAAHMAIRFLNSKGRELGAGVGEREHSVTVKWGTQDLEE